jgi:hypothetical protein
MSSVERISSHRLAVFTFGSPVDEWASIAVRFLAMSFEFILPFLRPIEPSFHRTTRRIATLLAPRKELKRRPFLGLHPGFALPPALLPIGT